MLTLFVLLFVQFESGQAACFEGSLSKSHHLSCKFNGLIRRPDRFSCSFTSGENNVYPLTEFLHDSKVPPDFPAIPPKPLGPALPPSVLYPTRDSTQVKIRITAEIAGENAFEPRWLKDSTEWFQRERKQRYEPAACCDSPQTVITFRCFMKPPHFICLWFSSMR